MNVDAALDNSSFLLVAVARDDKGDIIKVWAKTHISCSSLQVEANAILWAVQLAMIEGWNQVIIEGDAKACFTPFLLHASPQISLLAMYSVIFYV